MKSYTNLILIILGVVLCTWVIARRSMVPQEPKAELFQLEEIPDPDLSRLAKHSQEQIKEIRTLCVQALAAGHADPLLRARAIGELGKHYHAYELLDAAATCYDAAYKWQPTNYRWPYYLGHIEKKKGNIKGAADSISMALALSQVDLSLPKEQAVAIRLHLADLLISLNQTEQAQELVDEVLKIDPESVAGQFRQGQLSIAKGEADKGIQALEFVVQVNPQIKSALAMLATEYRKKGKTELATKTLERVNAISQVELPIFSDPALKDINELQESAARFVKLGNHAFSRKQFQIALRLYLKGLVFEPDNEALLVNIGTVFGKLGKQLKAREFWLRAIEVHASADAYFKLGQNYLQSREYRNAEQNLLQAIELRPKDERSYYALAATHSHAGDFDKALINFRKVLDLDGLHYGARLGEIRMLVNMKMNQEALDKANKCQQDLPEFTEGINTLARLLAAVPDDSLRNGTQALKLANEAYEKLKSHEILETVSMAYAEIGKFDQAVDTQQSILKTYHDLSDSEITTITQRLELYAKGESCREPWSSSERFPRVSNFLTVD